MSWFISFPFDALVGIWNLIVSVPDYCPFTSMCIIVQIGHIVGGNLIYAAHRRGIYISSRLFEILAHAELFSLFHLFTLFLEELIILLEYNMFYILVAVVRK